MNPIGVPVAEQDGGDPDEPERRHADDQGHLAEAAELQHDHGEHERDHQRRLREEGGVALGALLHRAADLEQGPRRHRRAQIVERAGDLLMHEARLQAWHRLALNGDRGQTAAAPDVAFVEAVLEPRELAQGHGGAASAS